MAVKTSGCDQSRSPSMKSFGVRFASSTNVVGSAVTSQDRLTLRSRSSRTGKSTGCFAKKARTRRSTSATSMAMIARGLPCAAEASRRSDSISRTHGSHHVAKKCTTTAFPAKACRSRRAPCKSSSKKECFSGPDQIRRVAGPGPCASEGPAATGAARQVSTQVAARRATLRPTAGRKAKERRILEYIGS